jgi:hypothetical protein
MLRMCSAPGCSTLTLGRVCVEHDLPVKGRFPRGRPFSRRMPRRAVTVLNTRVTVSTAAASTSESSWSSAAPKVSAP